MRDIARFATVGLTVRETRELRDVPALLWEFGLSTSTQEAFWVIAYDAALNIRTITEVARGSYARVRVSLPTVFTAVLSAGADRFIVAHNHPTGELRPTQKDIDLTAAIMAGANAVGLYFEDHYIVTPKKSKTFSFAAAQMLIPASYKADQEAAYG